MLRRGFVGGTWQLAWRKADTSAPFRTIPTDAAGLCDPFLFEAGDEHYLFAKREAKRQAEIVCYGFEDGIPAFRGSVLREPYALGYPCVFAFDGQPYMIPDSAGHGAVDLYAAVSFPDRWEKAATLARGPYSDATVLMLNGQPFLMTYRAQARAYRLEIYVLDLAALCLVPYASASFRADQGRPAGSCFLRGGLLMRPARDCSCCDGQRVLLYRVDKLTCGDYRETLVDQMTARDYAPGYQRLHTYNRDSVYEAIDLFTERISPLQPMRLAAEKTAQRILARQHEESAEDMRMQL